MSLYYYLFFTLKTPTDFRLIPFLKALASCRILGYLWFVYALLGFYLVVPFLSPMLKALSLKELRLLFGMLLSLIFLRNLCQITGRNFVLASFPLFQLSFMLLGYLTEHVALSKRAEILLYIVSLPMTVLSCYIELFYPGLNPAGYELSLSRVLMCLSLYLLIGHHTNSFCRLFAKPIAFVSGYTYFIYLIHTLAQQFFFAKMWSIWLLLLKMTYIPALFFGSVIIFILSLLLAIALKGCTKLFRMLPAAGSCIPS